MRSYRHLAGTALALLLLWSTPALQAQVERDPTIAPGQTTAATAMPAGVEGMTVMARDGKLHLVVGTRWYAVGDKVGTMRVDRISETEVWLHDGVKLIKVPRFAGIVRTAIVAKPACAKSSGAAAVTVPPAPPAEPSLSAEALRAIGNARNDRPPFEDRAPQSSSNKRKTSKKATTIVVDPAPNPLDTVAPCEDTPS